MLGKISSFFQSIEKKKNAKEKQRLIASLEGRSEVSKLRSTPQTVRSARQKSQLSRW